MSDIDFERWKGERAYELLMATETETDDPTEVVQISPGQEMSEATYRLVIVVSWPDSDDNPAEAMRWLHEEVAVRLEPGGVLFYESAVESE